MKSNYPRAADLASETPKPKIWQNVLGLCSITAGVIWYVFLRLLLYSEFGKMDGIEMFQTLVFPIGFVWGIGIVLSANSLRWSRKDKKFLILAASVVTWIWTSMCLLSLNSGASLEKNIAIIAASIVVCVIALTFYMGTGWLLLHFVRWVAMERFGFVPANQDPYSTQLVSGATQAKAIETESVKVNA